MKRLIVLLVLILVLVGCESNNPYAKCTVETCSQEMLIERIEVANTTTDGYTGEGKDAEEALVKLYGVTYKEVKELKNLQFAVDSLEDDALKEDCTKYCYYIDKYVKAIAKCSQNCNSDFITYEEIKDLTTEEATQFFLDKRQSQLVDSVGDVQEEVKEEPKQPTTEKGTCKEIRSSYTSQGLKITDCSYSYGGEIRITVKNNSGVDLSYIRVEIYGIDSNGDTILSDYTNHGSTIRDGASQTLETSIDYAHSYEVEITEAIPK